MSCASNIAEKKLNSSETLSDLGLTEDEKLELMEIAPPDKTLPPAPNKLEHGEEIVASIIGAMLDDSPIALEASAMLKPEYFKGTTDPILVSIIGNHMRKYSTRPDDAVVKNEVNQKALVIHPKDDEKRKMLVAYTMSRYETIKRFYVPLENRDYYLDQIRTFAYGEATTLASWKFHKARQKQDAKEMAVARAELIGCETMILGKEKVCRDFVDGNAVLDWADPSWLVPGMIAENSLVMIYGQPGSLKTFLALNIALSLSHGKPVLGHFPVIKSVPTAYISPEGHAGIKHRLKGWMEAHDVLALEKFMVNRHAFNLNDPDEAGEVIRRIAKSELKPKLLVIDTLARNFQGDENSTKEMSALVNNVMTIVQECGCAVLFVHHSGKDIAKGARGSIALTGAVDTSIEMVREAGMPTAEVYCRKQKEAEEFKPFVVNALASGPSLTLNYSEPITKEYKSASAMKKLTEQEKYTDLLVVFGDEPLTRHQMKDKLGSDYLVNRVLPKAVKAELVKQIDGDGSRHNPNKYKLTGKGIELLTKEREILLPLLSTTVAI